MQKIKNFIVFSFVFLSTFSITYGQVPYLEAGGAIGFANYSGDLSPSGIGGILATSKPSASLYARYNFTPHLNVKLSGSYASIDAKDSRSTAEWQQNRNLSFFSNIFEIGLTGEINLFKYNPVEDYDMFTIYLMAGIGGFYFNPKAELDGQIYELQPLGTEGQGLDAYPEKEFYSLYELAVPFGGGIKYRINESVNLNVELGWRFTFTDYLDDISGDYPEYYVLLENRGDIAARLSNRTAEALGLDEPFLDHDLNQRGNADVGDYYFLLHVGLTYNIPFLTYSNGSTKFLRRRSRTSACPTF